VPTRMIREDLPVRLTLSIGGCAPIASLLQMTELIEREDDMVEDMLNQAMQLASMMDVTAIRRSIVLAMEQAEKLAKAIELAEQTTVQ